MRKSRFFVAVLLVLALAACAGANANTVWDTHYDFSAPLTFDWATKVPEIGPDLPYDAIDRAVKTAVEAELSAAGFTQSSANPSYRLTYYVGVEEVTRISNASYYGPGWGASWGFGWHSSAGANPSLYDEGTITVDMLSSDPAEGMVWRGRAASQIDGTMSADRVENAVRDSVRALFSDFPPER